VFAPIEDLDFWIDFDNQCVEVSNIILTFSELEVIVENIKLGLSVTEEDET